MRSIREWPEGERSSPESIRLAGIRTPVRRLVAAAFLVITFVSLIASLLFGSGLFSPLPEEPEHRASILTAPSLSISHPSTIYVSNGVPFDIYINVTDSDNDNINITWDWGDGTPNETYMTGPAGVRTMVVRTHTWVVPVEQGTGGYIVPQPNPMRITIDDGTGNIVSQTRTIVVTVPENIGPQPGISAPGTVDLGADVSICANATDPEGESLTWTFVFNNGTEDYLTEVYYTPQSAPNELVWVNITHAFNETGLHSVTVYITDALGDNQQAPGHNNSDTAFINVVLNKIPIVNPIAISPSVIVLNESIGYLVVSYKLEVMDEDGDVLNSTWDFGNGSPPAYNESAGGRITYVFTQTVNYTHTGVFNVSVVTTDGRPGHEILRYLEVAITSDNLPPSMVQFLVNYSGANFAAPNQSVNFTLKIQDLEGDTIDVNISFGDGTWLNMTLSEFVEGNVSVTFNHSYALVGKYVVEVWYTDYEYLGLFNHSKYYNLTVSVDVPPVIVVDRWSWWDYTSLGLFCMIPVLIAVNFIRVRRRQREIEEQGMTMDEWKLRQSIEFEETMLEKKSGGQ